VFGVVDSNGNLVGLDSRATIPAFFQDGMSNTILFAEKYAHCTNPSYPEGGNLWAYWEPSLQVAQPFHPAFAVGWNRYCINEEIRIQSRPSPFLGDCDPTLPSTPHSLMPAAMADGHVRSISPAISGRILWALCTPAADDDPGDDWTN
jgi:hypothetical protein